MVIEWRKIRRRRLVIQWRRIRWRRLAVQWQNDQMEEAGGSKGLGWFYSGGRSKGGG